MNPNDPGAALAIAVVLFVLGLLGVMVRRNLLFMLISVEIMLNAAGLAFIAAGTRYHMADGQVMFLMILAYAAAEAAVGLAIVLRMHAAGRATLDADTGNRLKG
ncbi:NADH-quinone oxidoreductase subunit NuoK [Acidomonas methanolica]|uniref:NADH-quinone oxidoreductase subunit K n=1 Tax=Acidomonas methanolica NBRC 104435 TaxID=1231351 RepID=A0A023D3T1_ACIMT|nr:NADH-quinone oxidoreductase subunit NuoK [Acidomonas methanolica]MBU2655016.1 NADH-quinone oxidoreductase subunit NuoK [Acidomonas methanolica]MCQ9155670.1 NADH-quinone oxidoreductase subunit NuoK [Acidomonas methanolica]TCS25669.1 NADH dehydrogenase subunit K [Acidomonas methanolica]GAJ28476.1 NADH-quinone oxidoreductase subunit K [Acidomonas methanolica NBRC 104435]GBQ45225.1 NADH-quinone oxidoreductase subunit K [Acidomonas methanolica]